MLVCAWCCTSTSAILAASGQSKSGILGNLFVPLMQQPPATTQSSTLLGFALAPTALSQSMGSSCTFCLCITLWTGAGRSPGCQSHHLVGAVSLVGCPKSGSAAIAFLHARYHTSTLTACINSPVRVFMAGDRWKCRAPMCKPWQYPIPYTACAVAWDSVFVVIVCRYARIVPCCCQRRCVSAACSICSKLCVCTTRDTAGNPDGQVAFSPVAQFDELGSTPCLAEFAAAVPTRCVYLLYLRVVVSCCSAEVCCRCSPCRCKQMLACWC
jgi:hypothetical protein